MAIDRLELLDWKRRIFALYQDVRGSRDPVAAWHRWQGVRDELFSAHPQSPVPEAERPGFAGLAYFQYDPAARVLAEVAPLPAEPANLPSSTSSEFSFTRFALARFAIFGRALQLELYWLEGYGGGMLLPFCDATNGKETYAGGRYLLDTVKGADLGVEGDRLILDFNFAYHPSCVYDPRWACPLTPPPNRLPVPVRAGERLAEGR
jgi:uncharacterized protein (DUF1684 family)